MCRSGIIENKMQPKYKFRLASPANKVSGLEEYSSMKYMFEEE